MSAMQNILDASIFKRHRTPLVLQTEAAECSLACLAMIAGYYNYRIDLPSLRSYYNISLKGATLRDLVRVAAKMRLSTRAVRVEMSQLRQLQLPCILHWDHSHFVVLTRVGKRTVIIHDPALGIREFGLDEVSRRFTGIVLELWPSEDFERRTVRTRVRILDMIRRTHGFATAAFQILLISLFLEIVIMTVPVGLQLVIDQSIVANDHDLLLLVALGLGVLVGLRALMDFVRSWSIMAACARLTLQWKLSLFRYLLRLPLSFFERRHVGDLASRFMSLDVVQKTLASGPIPVLVDGLMSVALVVVMWLYDPLLTIIALSVMSFYALMRAVVYRSYHAANEEAIVYGARENSHFIETLRGIPSIKALVMGERRQACWNNYLVDRVGAELRVQKLELAYRTANTLLFGFDRTLIIYFGASAVMSGSLTVGMLIAFLAYKDQFSQRISNLLDTAIKLKLLTLHAERIADVALAEPEEPATASSVLAQLDPNTPRRQRAVLSARGIGFRYGDNEPPVIAEFDFDVGAGECVAIVGPSGAGKTTLLKILAGLLQPTAGRVLLNDVPVQAFGLECYRSQIGCVLQDDRLFAGSIAENIAAFSPESDLERIYDAARLAAIHEEILRMPMGYATLVGDMGSSLSGGQMQRIVLARALYRGPRILLLDEATSHLDDDNERLINTSIRSLPIARVIVAHRRSTIEMADRIVPIWPAAAATAIQQAVQGPRR